MELLRPPRMDTRAPTQRGMLWRGAAGRAAGMVAVCGLVSLSAVVTKEAIARARLSPLAEIGAGEEMSGGTGEGARASEDAPAPVLAVAGAGERGPVLEAAGTGGDAGAMPESQISDLGLEGAEIVYAPSPELRYFNGRAVRPARTMRMTVTAYSPDEKSCGASADGVTSSVHRVETNDMRLVAADSRVLALGSMVSIPGYDNGFIVPVLDRGGAIKGNKLDVLFPTDLAARKWGVKKLEVVVWEYADNLPADDFRAIRDSRQSQR